MSHSQFHSIEAFILRHAWLSLWDKHMTTGRINQVTIGTAEQAMQAPRHWARTARGASQHLTPNVASAFKPSRNNWKLWLGTLGRVTVTRYGQSSHRLTMLRHTGTSSLIVKRCKPGRHWIQGRAQLRQLVIQLPWSSCLNNANAAEPLQ